MKTNRLYIYALLILLAGGCVTRNYGPISPDYYPEMPGVSWQHMNPGAPPKVAAADGRANLRLGAGPANYDDKGIWNEGHRG
jgi:hypothetical protein